MCFNLVNTGHQNGGSREEKQKHNQNCHHVSCVVSMCHVWSSRVMCGVHVGKEDKVTDDVQINPPSQTQALLIYQELNYIMCGSHR